MAHIDAGIFPVAKPDRWLHPDPSRDRKRPLPVGPELAAAKTRAHNGRDVVLFKSRPCLSVCMRLGIKFQNFLPGGKATQYLPCGSGVQA